MTRKATNEQRIKPTNLRNLPTVLDSEQAGNVLRVSVQTVRKLARDGRLRRLRYSPRDYYFHNKEVERFLRDQTDPCDEGDAA